MSKLSTIAKCAFSLSLMTVFAGCEEEPIPESRHSQNSFSHLIIAQDGRLIYEGYSTAVPSTYGSGAISFNDAVTGKRFSFKADSISAYHNVPIPEGFQPYYNPRAIVDNYNEVIKDETKFLIPKTDETPTQEHRDDIPKQNIKIKDTKAEEIPQPKLSN